MTPPLKKLAIFGLAAGIGQSIQEQSDDLQTKWRAEKLAESAVNAVDACHATVNKSRLKQVERKIDLICKNKDQYDIAEMLSFLILGIQDLQYYCKDTSLIDPIEKRAVWFCKLFDPKLDNDEIHATALRRYEQWIN